MDKKNIEFLKDVFICSLGAFGGPEAHYGVFSDHLVNKKKYIKEEELTELIALTGILPGPSSTQTIVAIGHRIGGPVLAFLTMLVWAMPVILIMTLLSFLTQYLSSLSNGKNILTYITPMAVAFILVAAYRISSKVVTNKLTFLLLVFGALATYFIRQAWIYPLVLIIGGLVTILTTQEKNIWNRVSIRPPWIYLILFFSFSVFSIIVSNIFDNKLIALFESFYRYSYLVIGGGQVVVSMMYSDLVEVNTYISSQDFLAGFGLVQAMPGPMFAFSSYVGGLVASNQGWFIQLIAALISGVAIFLPGLLLIYFVYPIWEDLKKIKAIKISLSGITAVAGGLITETALIFLQKIGLEVINISVVILTSLALLSKKISAPIIVLIILVLGYFV